ncbi:MAG: hypothetical protein LQ345_000813 [Seirophora villosa]|nr:MAG: hypothetical protein LQ345_000813 [Seirophora villosa]
MASSSKRWVAPDRALSTENPGIAAPKNVRYGVGRNQCVENLDALLKATPAVEIASNTGSSGALTLLPTAGALIGAPSKELWVVYNLMPIAGILSMMLSIGGNIAPTDASGYEMKVPRFLYRGLVATRSSEEEDSWTTDESDSQVFAEKGERPTRRSETQLGLDVALVPHVSSLLYNRALRISRAPSVRISEDALQVRRPKTSLVCGPTEDNHLSDRSSGKCRSAPAGEVFEKVPLVQRTAWRVIAMWMASEIMKTKPVLHRVVKSRGLAAEYIDRILDIDGLVMEMMGHVIVNGRCIQEYHPWFQWSNWLGLLAAPYDLGKVTVVM